MRVDRSTRKFDHSEIRSFPILAYGIGEGRRTSAVSGSAKGDSSRKAGLNPVEDGGRPACQRQHAARPDNPSPTNPVEVGLNSCEPRVQQITDDRSPAGCEVVLIKVVTTCTGHENNRSNGGSRRLTGF